MVFPAHAGMDRSIGPPRPRPLACSPHTRGWTAQADQETKLAEVFPAHAGMDRSAARGPKFVERVPRTRGDGPLLPARTPPIHQCSPHTRGWTVVHRHRDRCQPVFPAHAGMDRRDRAHAPEPRACSPHTRGWTGSLLYRDPYCGLCSPHTRGWTEGCPGDPSEALCVPRTRGDGPYCQALVSGKPRVFPAHAGMDRKGSPNRHRNVRVPRTRGDGPSTGKHSPSRTQCSPHTRGWTVGIAYELRPGAVFPAHAGMDRPGATW